MPQSKPEIRVLQVFDSLGTGGAETWLIGLLKYFRDNAHNLGVSVRTDICLTSGQRMNFDDLAEDLGARLFYLPYAVTNLPDFARKFRNRLRQGQYHAVHDHQGIAAGFHFFLAAGVLPPVRIAHFHNPVSDLADGSGGRVLQATRQNLGRLGIRFFATQVLGTSQTCLQEHGLSTDLFARLGPRALHCGIDLASYVGDYGIEHNSLCEEFEWPLSARIVLFVGRLGADQQNSKASTDNRKNPKFALEVARECLRSDKSLRLVMVGSGDQERHRLQKLVLSWGLADRVRLCAARNDIPRLMIGSDLLIFPSKSEGLGMVAIEAQASGLRVLASDAVPEECSVVPGLVTFYSLNEGIAAWATLAQKILHLPRPDHACSNQCVSASRFAIENSAIDLVKSYGASGRKSYMRI